MEYWCQLPLKTQSHIELFYPRVHCSSCGSSKTKKSTMEELIGVRPPTKLAVPDRKMLRWRWQVIYQFKCLLHICLWCSGTQWKFFPLFLFHSRFTNCQLCDIQCNLELVTLGLCKNCH